MKFLFALKMIQTLLKLSLDPQKIKHDMCMLGEKKLHVQVQAPRMCLVYSRKWPS